ncbi:MAG: DUF2281 domain-containing protein [Tildeniella nuda ZEHNDER 1965/U140]|jgi:hypothetical protein|nr:DUF2281 domain-containing protein [Tildeniella nuda ZEHNDER 1965/U140]
MLETTILQNLEKLPEALKQEVLHYTEFLVNRYATVSSEQESLKRQGFGVWKDKITIADDFDEPLEDFKDYM